VDCDPFGWWFRLGLNVVSGALFGWAYAKLRSAERIRRHMAEMRTLTEENLTRSARLFRNMQTFPGDDDGPPAPPARH
jgi:hypothetical protein